METILPAAPELEPLILGAMLLDKFAAPTVFRILKSDSFYEPKHNTIFKAMHSLYSKGNPIDLMTVRDELGTNLQSVGGAYYLTTLTNRIASAANVEYHCRIIEQKAMLRRLHTISLRVSNECLSSDADVFDLIGKLNEQITSKGLYIVGSNPTPQARVESALKTIYDAQEGKKSGVMSGLNALDDTLGGFKPGELIILAARPGSGKTALAMHLLHNGLPSIMFQMEMSNEQLCSREIAMFSGISSDHQHSGKLTSYNITEIEAASKKIEQTQAYVDAETLLTPMILKSKLTYFIEHHNVKLCIVDYLQLFDIPTANRVQEIGKITRALKLIAKDLNIPIILLCQLSRAVEARKPQIPQLSDLRDSGEIEQDADVVILLYRPEYYDKETSEKNIIQGIVAKNRQGATGTVPIGCKIWLNQFFNVNPETMTNIDMPF